jgi:hypothetical protein
MGSPPLIVIVYSISGGYRSYPAVPTNAPTIELVLRGRGGSVWAAAAPALHDTTNDVRFWLLRHTGAQMACPVYPSKRKFERSLVAAALVMS